MGGRITLDEIAQIELRAVAARSGDELKKQAFFGRAAQDVLALCTALRQALAEADRSESGEDDFERVLFEKARELAKAWLRERVASIARHNGRLDELADEIESLR